MKAMLIEAPFRRLVKISRFSILLLPVLSITATELRADSELPIADAHVHYSHDSVELTPPERVIELMREANLKFALVSSSDDNGTQLLHDLAPDLIVPGLRPYRRRGELSTWFRDDAALAYVEHLLEKNAYASIGEFHLSGSNVDLPIPQRIVELAEEHNLVLHAHSDADAVERLLASSDSVKVLWAHAGFDAPEEVAEMLSKHDRLWADLGFRGEVGSGGQLSEEWHALFEAHPDRIMLGTDTYTPERMYFLPEHAANARVWLATLPEHIAENVAWKNAYDLLMPVWEENMHKHHHKMAADADKSEHSNHSAHSAKHAMSASHCDGDAVAGSIEMQGEGFTAYLIPVEDPKVSQPTSFDLQLCGEAVAGSTVEFDASMPAHGHGMNYTPSVTKVSEEAMAAIFRVDGVVMHMPGNWRFDVKVVNGDKNETLQHKYELQ